MTNCRFDVKLPSVNTQHLTQGAKLNYLNSNSEIKYIFEAFDTDGEKGILSEKELKEALDYLNKKESEIAKKGKKGDKVISYADFDEIAKDEKFNKAREDMQKSGSGYSVGQAIAFAAHMLSNTTHQNSRISAVGFNPIDYINYNNSSEMPKYPEQYGETKTINGKQVTLMSTGDNCYRLKNNQGSYINDPDLVAKAHGLKEDDSFLYRLGQACHLGDSVYKGNRHIIRHEIYEYEYKWDEDLKALVITKEVSTGERASSTR